MKVAEQDHCTQRRMAVAVPLLERVVEGQSEPAGRSIKLKVVRCDRSLADLARRCGKPETRIVKTKGQNHPKTGREFSRGDAVIHIWLRRAVSLRFLASHE